MQKGISHAKDYVKGMYMMLTAVSPSDYVLATGKTCTIREFINKVASCLGLDDLIWRGSGLDEQAVQASSDQIVVKIDPSFYRPCEVDELVGDPSRAEKELGWTRAYDLDSLIKHMTDSELHLLTSGN